MKNRTDFVSVGVKEQLVQAVRNQWEAARAVLWALLGLVVGLGNMMLEISPFGAALCAAVPLKNLVPAALGSAVGSLLLSGLVGGNFTIKYAAAILLIAVVRRMGREQLQRWSDYRPLVSAALAFLGLLLPTAACCWPSRFRPTSWCWHWPRRQWRGPAPTFWTAACGPSRWGRGCSPSPVPTLSAWC